MEDRNQVRERHGFANARKLSMASVRDSDVQSVTVDDGHYEVILRMETSSYPAGLSPVQAVMLAQHLVAAAKRVLSRMADGDDRDAAERAIEDFRLNGGYVLEDIKKELTP